ncbi:MAG: hypothetical protein K0R19_2055 [Bacillota bacterium]|nr:hypothetical protein [Bacillota bacterium]
MPCGRSECKEDMEMNEDMKVNENIERNESTIMNENIVMAADQYNRIDGRDAYRSNVKRLTLGAPTQEGNKNTPIAAQIWKETADGNLEISAELPIHQVMDLMIFLSRTMLHFREAYRLPLLYDPEKPTVERVGVQGGVMPVSVCIENPDINGDIKKFSQSLSDLGELTGERLRVLSRILEEMEYY